MPETFLIPSTDEQRRFLISFLFAGAMSPGPAECVGRAYRDFSRTAKGITKGTNGADRKRSAHGLVESLLKKAIVTKWTVATFDEWHRFSCAGICQHYARNGYPEFHIGQAQKWLNMSIKYVLSLAAADLFVALPGDSLRRVAHVPLDDFILTATSAYDDTSLRCPWSQIDDYAIYMNLQEWIRAKYPGSVPLDVEFHLYNEESARRRGARMPDVR
jgi:hypothetical protein